MADLADSIGLEVDDLLPLVDALVMLGFADLHDDRLELSGNGKVFAGASIQDSKEIFARACLEHAPLVRTIYRSLRGSMDDTLPAGFFTDILRTSFGEEEAARQLDIAVNWGRYAELYDYDAARGQIIREEQGIGATIADAPQPASRGSLTAYLGAAPGAGTTYTMLSEGRSVRAQGEDVVIGFADTHGRPHTIEAIGGLETVPPDGDHMDLTAVLARGPAVALVDYLGRHAAPIEALRSAGIHVISTANVADIRQVATEVEAVTGRAGARHDQRRDPGDRGRAPVRRLVARGAPQAAQSRQHLPAARDQGRVADRVPASPAGGATGDRSAARGQPVGRPRRRVPATARKRGPQDVVVAVWRPDQVEPLVQHGVRLARRRGARCFVVALSQPRPGQHLVTEALTELVEVAATAGGASVVIRESRDAGASIISAVQELNARHLVLAVPSAGMFERWRGTLLERLAGQLPAVHLHIQTAAGTQSDSDIGNGADQDADRPQQGRRGAIRVYLGYAPGCGTTTAMLEEANRREARGSDVVVGAVDARDREDVAAELEHLELIGDGTSLDTAAVLARRPEVVCVDDLTAGTTTAERRFVAARRLADAGITVVGTVQLGKLGGTPDGGPEAFLDESALLTLADEIELVDVPPSILGDRVRRGQIVPPDQVPAALATTFAPETLRAERERAFRLVAEHGERQLLAYTSESVAYVPDRQPSIVACAAPWPGMERLIRRSAALAAQVDGQFRVAAVRRLQPNTAQRGPTEDEVLASYAILTEQLGGEFATLDGAGPAPALAEYARQRQATELVLDRAYPNPSSRYPVLRELARLASDVELHVLPAEPDR